MSTLSKGSVYTAARYQRAIASSGGVNPQQILQAPSNGIVLVSGMMYHATLNNNGYIFFISSSNGTTGYNTSGSTVMWPGTTAGTINVGVGNGAGITTNWTMPASFNNGVLISGAASGYMYCKDLVVPSSHYLMWYLSGGAGAANIGYDLNTVIISQS